MIDLITFHNSFRDVFHSNDGNFSISLTRIFLGLVCIFVFYDLNCNKKYFSSKGYFPIDFRKGLGFLPSLFNLKLPNIETERLIFYIGLISSITLTLGLITQVSCLLTFICLASFANRNAFVFHSGTALLKLTLFLMIFSKAGQELSLDKYFNIQNLLPSFSFFEKLMMIQIAIMYAKTSFYKLLNKSWRDGSAIYYTSKNLVYSNIKSFKLFEKFLLNNKFSIPLCYLILLTEATISFSCLFSNLWFLVIGLGFLLHTSFIFFLRIREFPYICLASLLIFIPSEIIENYSNILFK